MTEAQHGHDLIRCYGTLSCLLLSNVATLKPMLSEQTKCPGLASLHLKSFNQYLVEARLVIADLTDHNPNVFYELAVRHAMKKPVVQLIQSGQRIPFDIAQMRTILYDLGDPDNVVVSRDQLIEQIRAVEANPTDVDNPISSGIQLQNLVRSDNPLAKSHAEIIATLQELRALTLTALTTRDREISTKKNQVQYLQPMEIFSDAVVIEEGEDNKNENADTA